MSLWDALECLDVTLAGSMCADDRYDVNEWKEKRTTSYVGLTDEQVTPLIWCAHQAKDMPDQQCHVEDKYVQIMRIILQHPKCRVNLQSQKTGFSALHLVCRKNQSVSAARLLLAHPEIDLSLQTKEHGYTVLHEICHRSVTEEEAIFDELVQHPKINDCLNQLNHHGCSALHHVCDYKTSVSAARQLLALPDIDLGLRDRKGITVLHTLMRNMNVDNVNKAEAILHELLKHPMINDCVYELDDLGRSALDYVCGNNKSARAAQLLLACPDINLGLQDKYGYTVLHRLITFMDEDNVNTAEAILDELVKHPTINDCLKKEDKYYRSALDMFITKEDFNVYDLDLSDALKPFFCKLLNAHTVVSASGRTLALAGTLASPRVFRMLIEHGANVNDCLKNGENTAFCVISRNSLLKCRALFQHNPVLTTTWNYLTPSMLADEYGCKDEIKQLIRASTAESKDMVKPMNPRSTSCNKNPQTCKNLLMNDYKHYKTHVSSKVRLDECGKYASVWNNHDALISVRYHRHFITDSTQHIAEITQIESDIMGFFGEMSLLFVNSPKHSHMSYKHFLCGSMGDGTKCYFPDEFDVDCVINETGYDYYRCHDNIIPKPGSGWCEHCNADGKLVVKDAAQAFYQEFARLCHEYNTRLQHQTRGIVKVLFQYMSKISRLNITWYGLVFKKLCINVDVVPIFKANGYKRDFPLGVKSNTFYALAKTDRHVINVQPSFPISVSDAEGLVMRALPEPIRQGFTTAKAARQASICAPGIDHQQYNIVEDLAIEDYLTSHSLKNSLLNLLQKVQEKPDSTSRIADTMCKYNIADQIYEEFQSAIEHKDLLIWTHRNPGSYVGLLNCTHCKSDIKVCCQKRRIRLALVTQIRAWLTNPDNLRFLHDGNDQCNCTYSETNIAEYNMKMDRLRQTGKLIDGETKPQPDQLLGSS